MSSKKETKPRPSDEWSTQEDVERDIWAYSEFCDHSDFEPAPPKTLQEWKNCRGQVESESIFDREIGEDVTYYVSGRGRNVPDRLIRPGEPIKGHASDTQNLLSMIRQTNGLGYRNEFIEQTVQSQFADQDEEAETQPLPKSNLALKLNTQQPTLNVNAEEFVPSSSSANGSTERSVNSSTDNLDENAFYDENLINRSVDYAKSPCNGRRSSCSSPALSVSSSDSRKRDRSYRRVSRNTMCPVRVSPSSSRASSARTSPALSDSSRIAAMWTSPVRSDKSFVDIRSEDDFPPLR